MRLIVGLGNVGGEFRETRHNTGFEALDRLAQTLGASFEKQERFQALIARPSREEVLLVKPATFMNKSGEAIAALARFYKLEPSKIWVVYDDVDLPVGTARSRVRGMGRTRHKGLLSIATSLGTHDFPRFRVGIAQATGNIQAADRPREPLDLKDFVLSPFDNRELPLVEKSIAWVVKEILAALKRNQVTSKTLTKGVST